jgi:hypothetical protein
MKFFLIYIVENSFCKSFEMVSKWRIFIIDAVEFVVFGLGTSILMKVVF